MNTRAQIAMTLVLGFVLLGWKATAETVRQIEFANGEKVEAIVIPASDCPVVVQTQESCLEVPLDQIRRVDGQPDVVRALADDRRPLLRNETFEQVLENGDLLVRSSFARANRSQTIHHEIDWGLAPHEVGLLEHWKVFDEFGSELALRIEDRSGHSKHAYASLVRPILPGETIRFTSEILFESYVQRAEETLTYRSAGNYPEDRLVSKMVKLPAGSMIVSMSPEPAQQFEAGGAPFVYWRRYYRAGEETPLEVVFRLGT